jgi:hypothetical protein
MPPRSEMNLCGAVHCHHQRIRTGSVDRKLHIPEFAHPKARMACHASLGICILLRVALRPIEQHVLREVCQAVQTRRVAEASNTDLRGGDGTASMRVLHC